MFAPLIIFILGLIMSFQKGDEEPILVLITAFGFVWTVYEMFFKPEPTSEEIDAMLRGKSKMKTRDWVEIIIMLICVVWIAAAAELTK